MASIDYSKAEGVDFHGKDFFKHPPIDSKIHLAEKTQFLAFRVMSDNPVVKATYKQISALIYTYNPSERERLNKELRDTLAEEVDQLVCERLFEEYSDPYGILRFKQLIYFGLDCQDECSEAFAALSVPVQEFFQAAYGELHYGLQLERHAFHTLKDNYIGDQSIFDYVEERLDKGLPLELEGLREVRDNSSNGECFLYAELTLKMVFVRIVQEKDPAHFAKIVSGMSQEVRDELRDHILQRGGKEGRLNLARCYRAFNVQDFEARKNDALKLAKRSYETYKYFEHLEQFDFSEEEKALFMLELQENASQDVVLEVLKHLKLTDMGTLREVIGRLSSECIPKALEIIGQTKGPFAEMVLADLARLKPDEYLNQCHKFSIDERVLEELKIEALKLAEDWPYAAQMLFKDGKLQYSEELYLHVLDRWIQDLYSESHRPDYLFFDHLVRKIKVDDEALKIARQRAIEFLPEDPHFFQTLAKIFESRGTLDDLTHLREKFPSLPDKVIDFIREWLSIKGEVARCRALFYGIRCLDREYPDYFYEVLIPKFAAAYRFPFRISDGWSIHVDSDPMVTSERKQMSEVLTILGYIAEVGLESIDPLTVIERLKPDLPDISPDMWIALQKVATLEKDRIIVYTIGIKFMRYGSLPPFILGDIIPAIVKWRNPSLVSFYEEVVLRMRIQPALLENYQKLVGTPPKAHLILPMLGLNVAFEGEDLESLERVKSRLLSLKKEIKQKTNGLSQAIQQAARILFHPMPDKWGYPISEIRNDAIRHFEKALEMGSVSEIKAALQQLTFLAKFNKLDMLTSYTWTQVMLEEAVQAVWKELYDISPETIEGFHEQVKKEFNCDRMAGALETYTSVTGETIMSSIRQYVQSVLTNTYKSARYDVSKSTHLKHLAENFPTAYAKWQSEDTPTPLAQTGPRERCTLASVKAFILDVNEHGHLGEIRIPATEAEATGEIEKLIYLLMTEEPTLARLEMLKSELEGLARPPEFLNDVKALIRNMQPHKDVDGLSVVDTDDHKDLFLIGTEVDGSCQRVDGAREYTICLLGYVMDGKNRAIVVKDASGRIIARRIFRFLLTNDGRPALFLEKAYGSPPPAIDRAIKAKAAERARLMGVPLYLPEYEQVFSEPYSLESKGSSMPYEYVDAGDGSTNGTYTIRGVRRKILDPIDHDLHTIDLALWKDGPISYTEALHKAAFCLNEKLRSDKWGEAARAYMAETGDHFSYNGEVAEGEITNPKRLLEIIYL